MRALGTGVHWLKRVRSMYDFHFLTLDHRGTLKESDYSDSCVSWVEEPKSLNINKTNIMYINWCL